MPSAPQFKDLKLAFFFFICMLMLNHVVGLVTNGDGFPSTSFISIGSIISISNVHPLVWGADMTCWSDVKVAMCMMWPRPIYAELQTAWQRLHIHQPHDCHLHSAGAVSSRFSYPPYILRKYIYKNDHIPIKRSHP